MIHHKNPTCVATFLMAAALLSGCKSKGEAALDLAKQQAALTGQPQQVVSIDKAGNTTTTVVQPPSPGQSGQTVTTTVTPAPGVPANTPVTVPANTPAAAPYTVASNSQPAPLTANPSTGNSAFHAAGVSVPAGTSLSIRINQHISVKTSRAGDHFDGEIAEPVTGDIDRVIIPRGTPVFGVIDAAHQRGHFKGASILSLRLTSMTLDGVRYPLDTRDLRRAKKGKGKRTAAFIGGGSGLGMLIGGVATGGVGLLAGGLAGAGAGTAAAGLTGNRDLEIPSESIMRFKLADDLVLQPS